MTPLLPTTSPAPAQRPWRDRALARLVEHLRALTGADAVTFITVDGERGLIEGAASWFADPDLRDALEPASGRPFERGRPGLAELALDRERALLVPRIDAWQTAPELARAAIASLGDERGRRLAERYRRASMIASPVRGELGRALGVLVVVVTDPEHSLGKAELRTVEVVADLAAMALERAELLEAEGGRARDELQLKRAVEAVSGSLELDQVYESVVAHAAAVTGATRALVTRFNSRTGELSHQAHSDFSEQLAATPLTLDSGSFGHVARTRSPVLRRRGEAEGFDLGLMEGEGVGALMHAPIELGPRLYGVLTVAHEDADRFGAAQLELLVRLARSSAAAVANAIDFQRERRLARALTLGFVPESLPGLPGCETGLLYAPAENEPTGGDVYGAWPMAGGREMAVLVGDVAGKGVETAALSSMVRFFVEARSWDSPSPSRVLEQANRMLLDRLPQDTFVTAFLGVLSRDSLRYCNAGHLPPLLVRGSSTRPVESHGLPLGVAARQSYGESELRLEQGDLVFAYTDGLIEARRSGEVYGAERLARLVTGWALALSPDELVRAVHEEVGSWADGLADDVVALALRRAA
jgi:GAF domain-containing protein